MPYHKIEQMSGNPHVAHIQGSLFEHNTHETARGSESMGENAGEKKIKELRGF